jgi:phosphatidylglycerol:prolipoprotein diacylglycerol transferase
MNPILIEIGTFPIRWYGVMIITACIVGIWVAGKEAERKGLDKRITQDFSFHAIMGALIGARFYYVVFGDWSRFIENPLSAFAIWQGGLAIHGGILGGLLVGVFYARKHHISFLKLADTFAPSLILGQAIGRIGCFFNGDAHGYPTDLPWGIVYSPESPAGQMFPGQALHPTQLYEMILNLIIFSILWKLRKKMKTGGHLFLLYVMLYSIIRIFVEHFRADKLTYLSQFSAAQTIGVIGIVLGLILMFALKREKKTLAASR